MVKERSFAIREGGLGKRAVYGVYCICSALPDLKCPEEERQERVKGTV